jgi:hypothetical protein
VCGKRVAKRVATGMFAQVGLTRGLFHGPLRKPDCPLCELEEGGQPSASAPNAPPPCMTFTRGRRHHVDTSGHFCPHAACSYHGRVGLGNIRANGRPNGRRWRQLLCLSCKRHFLETYGTPFHGKQVDPDKLDVHFVNPTPVHFGVGQV